MSAASRLNVDLVTLPGYLERMDWSDYGDLVAHVAAMRPEHRSPHMAPFMAEALKARGRFIDVDDADLTEAIRDLCAGHDAQTKFIRGGAFLLDLPEGVPAVWGDGEEVLWAQGEPLLLVGPPGVGKTTLMAQLVYARLGINRDVLGWPVDPTGERVLYLACDRPNQIARALARGVTPADRPTLDKCLVVWKGPPPYDIGKHPETLLQLAKAAGADTVVIDSLKDVVVGLTDDEAAAGYNRSVQQTIAAGIEVAVLHHQRKGQGGAKATTLEDVYGSTWITAGAGSVVLLHGTAGDLVVELTHLKSPASGVGPLKIEHDHTAGTSKIVRGFDPLRWLTNRPDGGTAPDCARQWFEKSKPTANEVAKARRALDRLVSAGKATKTEAARGGEGGTEAAVYRVDSIDEVGP